MLKGNIKAGYLRSCGIFALPDMMYDWNLLTHRTPHDVFFITHTTGLASQYILRLNKKCFQKNCSATENRRRVIILGLIFCGNNYLP